MLLGLVPLFPLFGFLTLFLFASFLNRRTVSVVGVGSIALSAICSITCAIQHHGEPLQTERWTWISFYRLLPDWDAIQFGFYLDNLSSLMICMVTFVATWIAIFSLQFMDTEKDLARFFACMNLFVTSMLVLVLADNLLVLLLGWEGVGLCSYLLIGFWYQNPETGKAATKAFITTRIGDIGLLVAALFISTTLGTLVIQDIPELALAAWAPNSLTATLVALCLLFAATGKSAQLPLQVWLPDAMLGPTPVSALIHAATMVTAGVYLIARFSAVFTLSSIAQTAVIVIGAATLLIAGVSALMQSDIKRVLAYSTMSQIGYMFLALGAGAYSAAMFHLLTHAFFKALLFLSAGVIGYSAHHEYNMFKLGGLRKTLPLAFYSFLVGSLCLTALPLLTSGFYSKEFVLSSVLVSAQGGEFAWLCGILGALLTGLYTFRALSLTFFGEAKTPIEHQPGYLMSIPLGVLVVFSIGIGFLQTPDVLLNVHWLSDQLADIFPKIVHAQPLFSEHVGLIVASLTSVAGILGGLYFYKTSKPVDNLITQGLGFDALYSGLFVKPYRFLSHSLRKEIFGQLAQSLANSILELANLLGRLHSGRLSDYASVIAFSISVVLIVGFMVLR